MSSGKQILENRFNEFKGSGKSKEEIYIILLNEKYKVDDINKLYHTAPTIPAKTSVPIINDEDRQANYKKTVNLLLVIGAVLIGAGVFSFIAANWSGMSKVIKVILIIIFMLGFYGCGFYMMTKTMYIKTGKILIAGGSIIYGAGIFLIGQIFNIQTSWLNGYLLWMLGVLLTAFTINSKGLQVFGIVIGTISMLVSLVYMTIYMADIISDFNVGPSAAGSSLVNLVILMTTCLISFYAAIWYAKLDQHKQI